ncbi:MAG: ABC transporter permease [Myxococcota bacterium]
MIALLSDTLTLFSREAIRYRRDRAYWVGQTVFPLAVVAFFGFGLNDVVDLPSGADYVGHLASGILVLVTSSGAVGAGFSLIEDRETGFLRALLIAPVAPASIVFGKLTARLAASLLLIAILLTILAIFTPLRLAEPVALLGAITAVTVVFVSLGIAIASRLRRLESFRLFAALVTVPLYLFSGIFYPITTLPSPMRWLAYGNPLSYGVDLFRFGLLGIHEIPLATSAVMLALLSVGATALAVASLDHRQADR